MLKGRVYSISNIIIALICVAFLTAGLASTITMTAPAAHAQAPSDITKAYFQSGWFEKNPGGEWDEYDAKGNLRYTFKEIRRDNGSIFLFLKQYGVNVELDAAGQQIFAEWPGRPRHVMHKITNMEIMAPPTVTPPPVAPPVQPPTVEPPAPTAPVTTENIAIAAYNGGVFEKSGQNWTERTDTGQTFSFREIGRDAERVYLFDTSRNAFIIIDTSARMIRLSDGGMIRDLHPVTDISLAMVSPNPPQLPGPKGTLSAVERATCIATGGKVERAGMLGAERCTRTFRDGGMTCSDSSQCQGKCLSGTDTANQSGITGTCQLTDNPFGCFAEVKDGNTEFALCVD